jgi:hypothetical protein
MRTGSAEKEGALVTAAVAAATAAAAYGVKHALERSGISLTGDDTEALQERDDQDASPGVPFLDTIWEFASSALLPTAEDAAHAAGKWVATNAPPVVRDRIVRRFVQAFDEHAS